MIENSKKRKYNAAAQDQGTTVSRGIIDANWQKLLSGNMMMEKGKENPPKNPTRYTGSFRRTRKKMSNPVDTNMESLKISEASMLANKTGNAKQKKGSLTKFIAMDCEMVGIGYEGGDHMLARISLVNKFGDCIYDKFVKAREEVKDYRTDISGIRKEDLINGEDFAVVQKEVAEILHGRILVGHSLKNDLSVLFLSHPKRNIRDTSKYKPFTKITKGSTPSLKRLAKEILGIDIQKGEHSSIEDAKAAMQLYCTVAKTWEQMLSEKRGYHRRNVDE
ncbi:RNA exonuclease 4-like [Battus philenor]|uniref:RNA exonuclease 4-like n=1 Tax=Battus philenor TaxID=42288 RepID=UPI0035CFAC57